MIFTGPISTPLTPFDTHEKIAPDLIDAHVCWSAEHGVTGTFILGTWGGFPILSIRERKKIAKAYAAAAQKYGIGCIVQIGTPCMKEAEELARQAREIGATAIAAVIPFYHSGGRYYDLDHYRKYFDRIRQSVDLPLLLYNNARTTGILLSPEDFVALVQDGIAGVKDGSKDVGWIITAQALLLERGLNAEIIPGNTSAILYARAYGLRAVTSGAAVSFPRLVADVFAAIDDGDYDRAAHLHALLMNTRRLISKYGNPAMITYALLKEMGIPSLGCPRTPWTTIGNEKASHLVDELSRIKGITPYL